MIFPFDRFSNLKSNINEENFVHFLTSTGPGVLNPSEDSLSKPNNTSGAKCGLFNDQINTYMKRVDTRETDITPPPPALIEGKSTYFRDSLIPTPNDGSKILCGTPESMHDIASLFRHSPASGVSWFIIILLIFKHILLFVWLISYLY